MKPRIIGVISAVCILLAAAQPIAAAGESRFIVSAAPVSADGRVEVTVSIADNPGIAGFTMGLKFDSAKFVPVSAARGAALTAGSFTSVLDSDVDASTLSAVSVTWYTPANITTNGALFTVRFDVKPGAKGAAEFTVSCNATNQALADVPFTVIGASVDLGEPRPFVTVVTDSTLTVENGSVTGGVSYIVRNNTETAPSADIILAIYSDTGKLIYVEKRNKTLAIGNNADSFTGITLPNAAGAKYTVKIFCWNAMSPLAAPAEFEFN